MGKWKSTTLLLIAAGCCTLGFLIAITADAGSYTSADPLPFWVLLAARALEFLLPALICAVGAVVVKVKRKD